jgi:hypothetical protein
LVSYYKLIIYTKGKFISFRNENTSRDDYAQLNKPNVARNSTSGIATGTTGTRFSVKDSIVNSISCISSLTTETDSV